MSRHSMSPWRRTGYGAGVGESALKGHLNSSRLQPVLNAGWQLMGLKCRVLHEPLLSSDAGEIAVHGIRIKQSALLPDFPGAAPPGYERTYGQPHAVPQTQPQLQTSTQLQAQAPPPAQPEAQPQAPSQHQPQDRAESQVQPEEAYAQFEPAAVTAAQSSVPTGQQSSSQAQDAEQSLQAPLQNLLIAVEAAATELPRSNLKQRVRRLFEKLPPMEGGCVRVGFMGEATREGVLTAAISSSMAQLWRSQDVKIRSVVRQVRLPGLRGAYATHMTVHDG